MDINNYTAHLTITQEIKQGKTTTYLFKKKKSSELYPITNDNL